MTIGSSTSAVNVGRSDHELRELVERMGPRLADASAEEVVTWAAGEFGSRWCVTSSFADTVLVHLIGQVSPGIDVLFLDTGYHFPETLQVRDHVNATLPVRVISVHPTLSVPEQDADFGDRLYSRDPDLCCRMRKVEPLAEALTRYDAWAAGLRRDQSPQRLGTRTVDFEAVHGKVKICPLAAWTYADVQAYARRYGLAVNPLVGQGYVSIGCQPCTLPVSHPQNQRAGRWPLFDKTECGIHQPVSDELSVATRHRSGIATLPEHHSQKAETRATTQAVIPNQAPAELDHLLMLEAESIFIMREVVAELERPVLLFSGGKDSIVMLRLAEKAFAPARIPFPVMHVDTGHNFPEVLTYRDSRVEELGLHLVVASVPEALEAGLVRESADGMRNRIQTPVLLAAVEKYRFDALFGGARRDEEKARAKERVFSFRDDFGQWDPKNQRPELWSLYNGRHHAGESIRVFPLSNWTELDVWHYIAAEGLALPEIYYAHEREVVERDGMLYAVNEFLAARAGESPFVETVRYRTVGDASCTAAVRSVADTVEKVIEEVAATRITERGATRGDDRVSEAAMEDRKREGYF